MREIEKIHELLVAHSFRHEKPRGHLSLYTRGCEGIEVYSTEDGAPRWIHYPDIMSYIAAADYGYTALATMILQPGNDNLANGISIL
jgi:hypothetical protein